MRHVFRYLVDAVPGPGAEVVLSAGDTHHLARVVRRGPGDAVEVIDAAGGVWPAIVVSTGPRAVVRLGAAAREPASAGVALHVGLMEWGRLDTVVEKAVELGAGEVVVFASSRARRVPEPEAWARRAARLDRVAAAAARQCGRAPLPPVRGLVPFDAITRVVRDGKGVLIDPRGEVALPAAIGAVTAPEDRIALVVGPEAGFSADEVAAARSAGATVAHMGPATLRADTAAIAALAVAAAGTWGEAP